MVLQVKFAPPNALVYVEDSGEPTFMFISKSKYLVFHSDTMLAIMCNAKVLGAITDFTLGEADEVNTGAEPAYKGILKTPSRKIAIRTVERKPVLELPVPGVTTTVTIWANKSYEPDIVVVGVS